MHHDFSTRIASAANLIEHGRHSQAEIVLRQCLAMAPQHVETMRLLALVRLHRRRPDEACSLLEQALALAPQHPLLHLNLGSVRRALDDAEGALASFRRACELDPGRAAAWFNLGKALKHYGHVEASLAPLQRAVALAPAHVAAHTMLGDVLKAHGDTGAAEQAYRVAVECDPGAGAAWWGLANLKTVAFLPGDIERMRKALGPGEGADQARIQMRFALARALEQAGDFDAAFSELSTANRLQRRLAPWDRMAFAAQADAAIAGFPAADPAADPDRGREIVFIVGLPRSGTTLVEQILAAHPQVAGASELPDLPAVLQGESRRRNVPFPHWCAAATEADWRRLGDQYLERTARWRDPGGRMTDKQPHNFLYAGALMAMFPAARVIACHRDPRDTALSCFQQYFAVGNAFSYGMDDIVAYLADFQRLCAHWSRHYPRRYLDIGYETLTEAPETGIRRLLEFCDLQFDPACLEPHRATRVVRSASAAQVREPIDRRGAGRWRAYARHLPEALRAGDA